jgi:hypothetical protein
MSFPSLTFIFSVRYRVQESDGSYFESFTALSWKRENRRMSAIRAAEANAEKMPTDERENQKEEEGERWEHKEQLYIDVLYTIANTVGCQVPGGQVRILIDYQQSSVNPNYPTVCPLQR